MPESLASVLQEIAHLPINQGPHHSGLKLLRANPRMALSHLLHRTVPEGNVVQVFQHYQAHTEGVIEVVRVIGETVGGIDDLSLQ